MNKKIYLFEFSKSFPLAKKIYFFNFQNRFRWQNNSNRVNKKIHLFEFSESFPLAKKSIFLTFKIVSVGKTILIVQRDKSICLLKKAPRAGVL